jgi:3',5'-cyclic AMP phosphodiesterase CpdA
MRYSWALCVWGTFACASLAQVPTKISDQENYRPTPLPDRIVLTWSQSPAKSQAVTWRTDTSIAKGIAEIAIARPGPEFAAEGKKATVTATTSAFKSDLSDAHFHTVIFDKLIPNTKYAYRVGDGVNWSEWNHFRTAKETAEKFTFVYYGDAQYQLKSHWSRLIRESQAAAPHARFAIHAGDLVNLGLADAQWGEWFQAAGPMHRTVPVVPTPGNHEYLNLDKSIPLYWTKQFALPDNGPAGLKHSAYYFDFQGVRIISLNTNEKLSEQAKWLEGVLANNPNRWTILTFHHPIYSATQGRDNPAMRKLWQPIFDKYRVDLVLQGHDHCYGRSGLAGFPGNVKGTVYVVSVSGPMFYPVDKENTVWMQRLGEGKQLFQVITVDGDRLHFEARTAIGDLYDSFTLEKQPGQPNRLTDGPHDPTSVPPSTFNAWNWLPVAVILLLAAAFVALRRRRMVKSTE